jgi:hypothetical protein
VSERLPDPGVAKHRTIEIELEGSHRGIERRTQGIGDEIGILGQSGEISVDRRPEMNRVALQGIRHRRRIGQETHDQSVEEGPRRIPIIGITLENDVIAAFPGDEAKRPRADRRQISGIG